MTSPFESSENLTKKTHPDDTDLDFSARHHTLGKGSTQAAAGNHKHDISEIVGSDKPIVVDHQALTNRDNILAHEQYLLVSDYEAAGGAPVTDHQLLTNRDHPDAHDQYSPSTHLHDDYVVKTGDTMEGELTLETDPNEGLRFYAPYATAANQLRTISMRQTSGTDYGLGVHDGANSLRPLGVGESTLAEHATTKNYVDKFGARGNASRINHTIPNGVWTQGSGWGSFTGSSGVTSSGGVFYVPAGFYVVSGRAQTGIAGRVIVAVDNNDNGYGGQSNWLFDIRAAAQGDFISGSRMFWCSGVMRMWLFTTPAIALNYYIDFARVSLAT